MNSQTTLREYLLHLGAYPCILVMSKGKEERKLPRFLPTTPAGDSQTEEEDTPGNMERRQRKSFESRESDPKGKRGGQTEDSFPP